jgi:hypothetical protein
MAKTLLDRVAEKRQEEMMSDPRCYKIRKPDYLPCWVCGTPVSRRIGRDTCAIHMDTPASIVTLEME